MTSASAEDPRSREALNERITLGGSEPTIRDLPITVESILECMVAGEPTEQILQRYPSLEPGDIEACRQFSDSLIGSMQRGDGPEAFLADLMHFIVQLDKYPDPETLEADLLSQLPSEMTEDIMPTIADTFRQEGRLENARRFLKKLLTQRFGPLPPSLEQRIDGADEEVLAGWFDQGLRVSSLEDLFSDASRE